MNGIVALFALFDSKAAAFLPVFSAPTKAFAIRLVTDMVNDPQQQVAKHPDDYSLFQLGVMNMDDGVIKPEKMNLGNCVEFKDSATVDYLVGEKTG